MPARTHQEITKLTSDFLAALDAKDSKPPKIIKEKLVEITELANQNQPKALFCLIEYYGGDHKHSIDVENNSDHALNKLIKLAEADNIEAMELVAKHYQLQAGLRSTPHNLVMITKGQRAENLRLYEQWHQKAEDAKHQVNMASAQTTPSSSDPTATLSSTARSRTPATLAPPPTLAIPTQGILQPKPATEFDPRKQLSPDEQNKLIKEFHSHVNNFVGNNTNIAAGQYIEQHLKTVSTLAYHNNPKAMMALLVYYSDQRSKSGGSSSEYNYWLKKLDDYASANIERMKELESSIEASKNNKNETQILADYYKEKISPKSLLANKDVNVVRENLFGYLDWARKAAKNDTPKAIYDLCLLYTYGRDDLKFVIDNLKDMNKATDHLTHLYTMSHSNEEAKKYFNIIKENNIPGLREKIHDLEATSFLGVPDPGVIHRRKPAQPTSTETPTAATAQQNTAPTPSSPLPAIVAQVKGPAPSVSTGSKTVASPPAVTIQKQPSTLAQRSATAAGATPTSPVPLKSGLPYKSTVVKTWQEMHSATPAPTAPAPATNASNLPPPPRVTTPLAPISAANLPPPPPVTLDQNVKASIKLPPPPPPPVSSVDANKENKTATDPNQNRERSPSFFLGTHRSSKKTVTDTSSDKMSDADSTKNTATPSRGPSSTGQAG